MNNYDITPIPLFIRYIHVSFFVSVPPLSCANVKCAGVPCIDTPTGPKCTPTSTTEQPNESRPPLTCANVLCAEGPCIETPTGPKCSTMSTTEPQNENECGENEHWVGPCASRCEGTCDKPIPTVCTLECFQGCKCKPGFVRQAGKCILLTDCPKKND